TLWLVTDGWWLVAISCGEVRATSGTGDRAYNSWPLRSLRLCRSSRIPHLPICSPTEVSGIHEGCSLLPTAHCLLPPWRLPMRLVEISGPIEDGMWSYGAPYPAPRIEQIPPPDWLAYPV